MEERGGAHRVTQRSLDGPGEPPTSREEPAVPGLDAPAPSSSEPAEAPDRAEARVPRIVLDGPAEVALRRRQSAWLAERARYDAHRRPAVPDEGSK